MLYTTKNEYQRGIAQQKTFQDLARIQSLAAQVKTARSTSTTRDTRKPKPPDSPPVKYPFGTNRFPRSYKNMYYDRQVSNGVSFVPEFI